MSSEFENYKADLNDYKKKLAIFSRCTRQHYEYLNDRINYNKIYINAEIDKICQEERSALQSSFDKIDNYLKDNVFVGKYKNQLAL